MSSDKTRRKISQSQRDRYERERREENRIHDVLIDFALWFSPVWDANALDDITAATEAVETFLAGGDRD